MKMNGIAFNKRALTILLAAGLCLALVIGLTGCGLRDGKNNQPPAPPTNLPGQQPQQPQPTTDPAQVTEAATQPPQSGVTEESDPQGDEIEGLLDQLDQDNQGADPLDDLPE